MVERVLIVKTGHTEFLAEDDGGTVSLGDVYRATCLLWDFKDAHVTWLTSEKAKALLPGKPFVNEVFCDSRESAEKVLDKEFDLIINLERGDEFTNFAEKIRSKNNARLIQAPNPLAEDGFGKLLPLNEYATRYYQEYLFTFLDIPWCDQPYTVPQGISLETEPTFDVGFNFAVGSKWPTKAWPEHYWKALETLCSDNNLSYSYQQGFNDLHEYMHWILDHKILVTNDSLGLHLGLGLKRKVIALFGPSVADHVYFYNQGEALKVKTDCPKVPCLQKVCDFKEHCMLTIKPETVLETIKAYREKT